ncbi:hypothetical protein LPJ75_006011, partial [Coemansia sp. RSA 2598]
MRRSTRASKAALPEPTAEDNSKEAGKWSGASSPLSSLSTPASTLGAVGGDQRKGQQPAAGVQQERRRSRRVTRSTTTTTTTTGAVAGGDSVDELLTRAAQVIQEQVSGRGKRKGDMDGEDESPARKRRGGLAESDDDDDEEEEDEEEEEERGDEPAGANEPGAKWWPGKRGRPPKAVSDTRRLAATPRSTRTPRSSAARRLGGVYALENGHDADALDSDASVLDTPTKRPTRASGSRSDVAASLVQPDESYGAGDGSGPAADEYPLSSSEDEEEDVDPEGEAKIDALGYLQGGREFICPVVRSPFRRNQKRQYILTMDCCRFTGARDSYMLFKQHPRMRRVETTQQERDMLAENKMIPKVTRFRPIAMITARTAFREFGALIVKNGRYIVDDYWVAQRKKEAKYPEGTLVANMSVYHSVMAAHAAGVTPSSTRKARRMTPHRANSNDNG